MSLALVTKGKLWPKHAVIREEIDGININVSETEIGVSVTGEPIIGLTVDDIEYNVSVSTSEDSVSISVEEVENINFEVGC